MADIRINSLSTTASASSSDDFLALDGATNGTRKLNAYSPTFGGNLTVSGNASIGTNVFKIDSTNTRILLGLSAALQGDTLEIVSKANAGAISLFGRASDNQSAIAFRANGAATQKAFIQGGDAGIQLGGGSSIGLTIDSSQNATLAGNLTVSGGTISSGSGTLTLNSSANTVVLQSAGTTALTLDSSQNATFAGNVTAVKAGTAFYSIESTVNGALSEVIVKGKNSTGTAREARLGLNKYADDVFSIYDGTTERFRLGLTNGNATVTGALAINNTVQTAVAVASTHKVTISIGGSTYYLLATNV